MFSSMNINIVMLWCPYLYKQILVLSSFISTAFNVLLRFSIVNHKGCSTNHVQLVIAVEGHFKHFTHLSLLY